MLGGVELIDPEDVDGCWWEVVVAVEGTIEIAFIIFFYLFDEFRLIRTIDHPWKYGPGNEGPEAHADQVEFIGVDDCVICRVVGIPSDFGVNLCHFVLVLEEECED